MDDIFVFLGGYLINNQGEYIDWFNFNANVKKIRLL